MRQLILALNHRQIQKRPESTDILYSWGHNASLPDNPSLIIWHWCPHPETQEGWDAIPRWCPWGTGHHTLVKEKPLHLEPSLSFPCCGIHGFIRGGEWQDA